MLLDNILHLRGTVAEGARLMALDIGSKTIGLAVSDAAWIVASPVKTIRRTRMGADAAELFRLADERGVGGLVAGLPVNMDGSEGPRCQSVRAFADNLLAIRDIPLAWWDERWSTLAVERAMIDADLSRAKRAKAVDAAAAAYILQGALDRLAAARRDG
ncbi:MAG: Holliday junction resolvase RuvX [Rhodospirillaceae bacterium]|nr:Holliday junction resolvase RuvX [Rhodospirillaceae bacterium]